MFFTLALPNALLKYIVSVLHKTEIRTHNTDLKKRLSGYDVKFPDLSKLTDEDTETGFKVFEIEKSPIFFPHDCIKQRVTYESSKRDDKKGKFFKNFIETYCNSTILVV